MRRFSDFHPAAKLWLLLCILCASMFFGNPFLLALSLLSALLLSLLCDRTGLLKRLAAMLPFALLTLLINPLIVPLGNTVWFSLFGRIPITAESFLYGVKSAVMLLSVLLWCRLLGRLVGKSGFLTVAGKVCPSTVLLLSMSLRLVPLFSRRIKETSLSLRAVCLTAQDAPATRKMRTRTAVSAVSAAAACSLERSLETADSMRARGYGSARRTRYPSTAFLPADALLMAAAALLFVLSAVRTAQGALQFEYYPTIAFVPDHSFYFALACFSGLALLPVLLELSGGIRWKYCISGI